MLGDTLPRGDEVRHPGRGFLTWRAIAIGSLLVALMATLTPYNDYVVFNTLLVGSYFPPVVVLSLFVLVLGVNAPLHALRPRWALGTGELAVILGMLLVGCAVPGQGMLRVFLPTLVSSYRYSGQDPAFAAAFSSAGIPAWLFPVDPAEGSLSKVVTQLYGRTPPGQQPPYWAWIIPIGIWGVFLTGMYMALLSLAALLRNQWANNERLPFPLAQLGIALIQPPEKGRWVNELLARRSFWVAAGVVFLIHLLAGLHVYFPRQVPEISLTYNIEKLITEPPWNAVSFNVKKNTVFFIIVGIMFFIPSRVGFSLWATYLLMQGATVVTAATTETTLAGAAWADQHLGASVVFLAGVMWVGRWHWAMVTRHVFFGPKPDETVSYRRPALLLALGGAIMFGWLLMVGVRPHYAMLFLGCGLLAHLVVARVIAETGIPLFRSTLIPNQIITTLPVGSVTGKEVFFSGVTGMLGAWTTRESSLAFGLHAMRVTDEQEPTPRQRTQLMGLLVWSLVLAFGVGCASHLFCYYRYATPLTSNVQSNSLNEHATLVLPKNEIVDPLNQHATGKFAGKAHDPTTHRLIGAGVMAFMQLGAWMSASWPLAPVGYLVGTTNFIHQLWWSIFLGWAVKALIVRFGGTSLFYNARPFFVGLIFGEGLAATFWLISSFLLAFSGHDYIQIRLLPT